MFPENPWDDPENPWLPPVNPWDDPWLDPEENPWDDPWLDPDENPWPEENCPWLPELNVGWAAKLPPCDPDPDENCSWVWTPLSNLGTKVDPKLEIVRLSIWKLIIQLNLPEIVCEEGAS